jgi:hypothetical protein
MWLIYNRSVERQIADRAMGMARAGVHIGNYPQWTVAEWSRHGP